MIYRKSAMVFAKKNKVQCNNSLFIFETSTIDIELSNFNDEEKDKIKKASNFFNVLSYIIHFINIYLE
jgi:hypothetical protein